MRDVLTETSKKKTSLQYICLTYYKNNDKYLNNYVQIQILEFRVGFHTESESGTENSCDGLGAQIFEVNACGGE